MGKSKFSSKGLELKRTLVVSGLALAGFVTGGVVRASEASSLALGASGASGASDGVPGNKLETDYPNEGEIKTQEVLAGVERGGFAMVYDEPEGVDAEVNQVLDPVNPWGPNGDPVGPDDVNVPPIFVPADDGWMPRYYFYFHNGNYYFYYPGYFGSHIGHWHGGG